jgi:hypothetical protein
MMEGSKKHYVDNTNQFSSAGLTIRQKEPKNLEGSLRSDRLLSHSDGAVLHPQSFSDTEIGPRLLSTAHRWCGQDPFALSYDELRSMPSETRVATLECAGNSRVFLVPQVQGAQWELGAVSNAEWTGVPLRALLERAGLAEDACEIVLEGADRGTPKEEPVPPDRSRMPGACPEPRQFGRKS